MNNLLYIRKKFEELPETCESESLTRKEFDDALKCLKNGKATGRQGTGADSIPAEVWKNFSVVSDVLFEFLKEVWNKEELSEKLIIYIFVMIYKKKGMQSECLKYRTIDLLNHTYKVMSIVLL